MVYQKDISESIIIRTAYIQCYRRGGEGELGKRLIIVYLRYSISAIEYFSNVKRITNLRL